MGTSEHIFGSKLFQMQKPRQVLPEPVAGGVTEDRLVRRCNADSSRNWTRLLNGRLQQAPIPVSTFMLNTERLELGKY